MRDLPAFVQLVGLALLVGVVILVVIVVIWR
jgi:hypothetical protein